MLKFIDISNHQKGLSIAAVKPSVDAVVCKATEGLTFVDRYCDGWIQACIKNSIPFGFYHFARNNDAIRECDFFLKNTEGYNGRGIPVLDWEDNQSVQWVNTFVRHYHSVTGVWPWIYANPWRFNQGGVESNCMRWIASYPRVAHPTFAQASTWNCPSADGTVGAWQFCSDGRLNGWNGNLDCNLFYGDVNAWNAYCGEKIVEEVASAGDIIVEDGTYKVTISKK